jgi:hypothetical protein
MFESYCATIGAGFFFFLDFSSSSPSSSSDSSSPFNSFSYCSFKPGWLLTLSNICFTCSLAIYLSFSFFFLSSSALAASFSLLA